MSRRQRAERSADARLQEISRELHDQVAQTLNLMLVDLERFKGAQIGRRGVLREIDFLQAATRQALANLRRVVYELRSQDAPLEDLRTSLAQFRDRVARMELVQIEMSIAPEWPETLPADLGIQILRIVQEAATNALRHSAASSLRLELAASPEYLMATITDDGQGIDPLLLEIPTFGMRAMRERAALIGGDLVIDSRLRGGTVVTLSVPREEMT